MQTKPEIKIVPIFDQMASPKIWQDFARVEINARAAEGCPFTDGALDEILSVYRKEWQEPNNIAFGAFLDGEMIGFTKGHMLEQQEYKLVSLFVRHDMQRQGIGRRLLSHFENTVALSGSFVQGQCFEWSIPFYKKQGYTVTRGIGPGPQMSKELQKPHMVGVVPVFKPLCRMRVKIKVDYDKNILKQCKNQPVFVYVTSTGEIDAIAARTPDKSVHVWTNQQKRGMEEFYEKLLLIEMSKVK